MLIYGARPVSQRRHSQFALPGWCHLLVNLAHRERILVGMSDVTRVLSRIETGDLAADSDDAALAIGRECPRHDGSLPGYSIEIREMFGYA